jgi:hypothetical protein
VKRLVHQHVGDGARELPYCFYDSVLQVARMARIKVRCPAGIEYTFAMGEEFSQVVRLGSITAAWEVFHKSKSVWLPMALHPLFRQLAVADSHGSPNDSKAGPAI